MLQSEAGHVFFTVFVAVSTLATAFTATHRHDKRHLNTCKEYFLGCEYIHQESQTWQCEKLWPNTRIVPSHRGAWKTCG